MQNIIFMAINILHEMHATLAMNILHEMHATLIRSICYIHDVIVLYLRSYDGRYSQEERLKNIMHPLHTMSLVGWILQCFI